MFVFGYAGILAQLSSQGRTAVGGGGWLGRSRPRGCLRRGFGAGRRLFVAVVFDDNAGRVAYSRGPSRNGLDNDSIGTNLGPSSDGKAAQYLGASPNDYPDFQGRVAFGAFVQTSTAQGNPLIDGAVIAYDGGFTNDHAYTVVKKPASAAISTMMDLKAGKHPIHM